MTASRDMLFRERLTTQTDLAAVGTLLAESADTLGWERVAFHSDVEETRLPRSADGQFVAVAMGWAADYVNHWSRGAWR